MEIQAICRVINNMISHPSAQRDFIDMSNSAVNYLCEIHRLKLLLRFKQFKDLAPKYICMKFLKQFDTNSQKGIFKKFRFMVLPLILIVIVLRYC